MQFDRPTDAQMMYRFVRLRRLLVLAVALPVCVILGLSLLDPVMMPAARATLACVAVALLMAAHVVFFPNATLETISLSVVLALLVVAAPFVRVLAQDVPFGSAHSALITLVFAVLVAAAGLMWLLQMTLGWLLFAGPKVAWRVTGAVDLDCSVDVARRQFALRPNIRRGRIATGAADADGFFEVAIDVVQAPMAVTCHAKVLHDAPDLHQMMLVTGHGAVTTTSQRFTTTPKGCRVALTELPGDFTAGLYAMFWLTDQQVDNLTESADVITGEAARANGLAHGLTMLQSVGAVLAAGRPVVE